MLWLVNSVLIVSRFVGAQGGMDVCTAAKTASTGKGVAILVRGRGQVLDDGLALASELCPIARTGYDRVPTVILVNVTSFATPEVRSRFVHAESERGRGSPTLDVEARGTLNCRAHMRFIRSGPDIVGANGFGILGLYRCTLNHAELIWVADAKMQPNRTSPSNPKQPGGK
jgi:hypothetical protein